MQKFDTASPALRALVAVAVLAGAFACGYFLGLRNASVYDVSDNGGPAAGVRTEIDVAGSSISAAESGIDNAAAAADRIENRIEAAQERVEYIKGTADEGRRIIAECQSILREVRAGGKTGTAPH